MWYYILYFYRWLKVTLLNICRYFSIGKYEDQRYVPGDIVVIDSDEGKYFVEVLGVENYGGISFKPVYKLKSVMGIGFNPSKYVYIAAPNRRATPREMRKYALFLSQLKLESGDWFYNNATSKDVCQILKVEMSYSPSCCPNYTISSFSGYKWSTLTLTSNNVKLPNQPKFRYSQKVYVKPINKQGVVIGG